MTPLTDATRKILTPAQVAEDDYLHVQIQDDQSKFVLNAYREQELADGKKVRSFPSYRATAFISRFPERRELTSWAADGRGAKWQIGATDMSVSIIDHAWPKSQIKFDPDAKLIYDYYLLNGIRQDRIAEATARFKTYKIVPEHNIEFNDELPLAPYQQVAVHNAMGNEGYALFMEQGTGKSYVTVSRICNEALKKERRTERDVYRVLIVCPKQVRLNWVHEFMKFSTQPGRVTRIFGNKIRRIKQLANALRVESDDEFLAVIVNYETLSSSWEALGLIDWDLAVLDESHYIKNPTTKRWEYAQKLRDKSAARMVLTGTPIANTPMDLYTQFEFLGEHWSGFTSYNAFRNFYGVWESRSHGLEALVAFQNIPFLQERLAKQSYMIRKEEALPELPEKVYDTIEVEMTAEQEDVYTQVAENLAIEIESELAAAPSESLVINNILTKLLRLNQITSGFLVFDKQYTDDGEFLGQRVDRFDPNPKLERLVEELKEKGPHDKTIIWSCYVEAIRQIRARLELEGIDCVTFYGQTKDAERDLAISRFNTDPTCKVFIGNPVAGGAGLNLLGYDPMRPSEFKTNANHIIYFCQNWSAVARSQSEDRAHRKGTRVHVRISDLTVPMTIDEEIRARVMRKIDLAYQVNDVKEVLQNVLHGVRDLRG